MSRLYYFGCWDGPGHYHFLPGGRIAPREAMIGPKAGDFTPWGWRIDTQLCPRWQATGERVEGNAALHHRDGWTAVAFWDRSVDGRHNSCSVFAFEELLSFDEAVLKAKHFFPEVWARYRFTVRLTLVVEPKAAPAPAG